jgi:hypothetical protein
LHIDKQKKRNSDEGIRFTDIGRLKLNRKKQKEGIEGLRITINYIERTNEKLKPIFAGAAISGLFVILYDIDRQDYFRIKNIPDTPDARRLLGLLELKVDDTVSTMKATARNSLAQNDKRSNVV